jgi:hypothetical protein
LIDVGENGDVNFEVFMVVIIKIVGYWVVTSCFVGIY